MSSSSLASYLAHFYLTSHYVADEALLIFLYALNLLGDVGNELVYLGTFGIKVGDYLLLRSEEHTSELQSPT